MKKISLSEVKDALSRDELRTIKGGCAQCYLPKCSPGVWAMYAGQCTAYIASYQPLNGGPRCYK